MLVPQLYARDRGPMPVWRPLCHHANLLGLSDYLEWICVPSLPAATRHNASF